MIDKTKLRQHFKAVRLSMTEKNKKDNLILNRFKDSDIYINNETFLLYVSLGIEVDTLNLIDLLLSENKRVAVPISDTQTCTMKFYYIESLDTLEKGAYDIREPKADETNLVLNCENTVCVVPGLSFDKRGFRLGFGKGYYDRFLSEYNGTTVGLCYDECLSEKLISHPHDMSVQYVVTETKIYNTKGDNKYG